MRSVTAGGVYSVGAFWTDASAKRQTGEATVWQSDGLSIRFTGG